MIAISLLPEDSALNRKRKSQLQGEHLGENQVTIKGILSVRAGKSIQPFIKTGLR